MKRCMSIAVAALVLASGAFAQSNAKDITITRGSGASIKTDLGHGIVLNKESSLTREWSTLHDASMPLDLKYSECVEVKFVSGRVSGEYVYSGFYGVVAKEPVRALEVRFMLFDVFGSHIRTLSSTKVVDLEPEAVRVLDSQWRVFSENEASEYFACLSYVARVRTASGKVYEYNSTAVLEAARQFSGRLTAADLEPEPEKR
ncbi:MAG: hypothetical protein KJZ96_15550 [Rhodocyclaceae bacterium]|nr:hypothetical protein [Rhodocyclaceae bacterium]